MIDDYPQQISAPFVARTTNVLHRVAVEHEPYTKVRPGVATLAIVTTACKRHMQGVPVQEPIGDDRICSQCEAGQS